MEHWPTCSRPAQYLDVDSEKFGIKIQVSDFLCKCLFIFLYFFIYFRIEHLLPEVLGASVAMIFGHLMPRIVIMTTPNAEFNVLFPGFSGFRHWDHKFEWTRSEFQSW